MLKKLTTGIALGALALSTPIAAQDAGAVSEDMRALEALNGIFGEAEALTAEQEASLPAAEAVVAQIFPQGTYAKMMEETMKPMMDGMMGAMLDMPASELAKLTGLASYDLEEMGEGTLGEAMAIMDPDYEQRSKVIGDTTVTMITDLMNQIEPSYRAGLARAYAVRFSEAELNELNGFFSTPTGSHYAAESMLIYTDPQVMSAMNEMMPAMMEMMPNMMEAMGEATADLREPRKYSDLSEEEQARLAEIFGVSREDLAEAEPAEEEWGEDYGEEGVVEEAS